MTSENDKGRLITVVIPVYNRETIVTETLASIAAQSYRPFSVILVDNASTDGSLATLRGWKESMKGDKELEITVTSCTTAGAAAARNAGLRLVTTPWVMFFDSDDLMGRDHLLHAAQDIESNPGADIVGWDVVYSHASTEHRPEKHQFATCDTQWRNIFNGALATLRYCMRTELARRAGGWNENVGLWDDIELGCRVLTLNPVVIKSKNNDNRVTVRVTTRSITGDIADTCDRMDAAMDSIARTIGDDRRGWVMLKKTITAAVCSKAGSRTSGKLYRDILSQCDSATLRFKLRLAYRYTCLGGRGIAMIYRKLHLF